MSDLMNNETNEEMPKLSLSEQASLNIFINAKLFLTSLKSPQMSKRGLERILEYLVLFPFQSSKLNLHKLESQIVHKANILLQNKKILEQEIAKELKIKTEGEQNEKSILD
jgi:hypothetical protein